MVSLFIANIFGWVVSHWRPVAIGAAIAVIAIASILFVRSCGKRAVKLDEAAIQKAQQAIAERDQKAMVEVLAESDANEAVADATSVNANVIKVNALKESRDKWNNASLEEMQAELERRAKPE